MTEVEIWEGISHNHSLGTIQGFVTGNSLSAEIGFFRLIDEDKERYRNPKETAETLNLKSGIRLAGTSPKEIDGFVYHFDLGKVTGIKSGKARSGKTSLFSAMYSERDRIPRIGVHKTISGYGIAGSDIIITGKNGISSTFKTDERGVWWGYLPVDDYSNANIRSFVMSGGKVYKLLEQTEREEGYIWDEIMQCITTSGNGYRMISRVC